MVIAIQNRGAFVKHGQSACRVGALGPYSEEEGAEGGGHARERRVVGFPAIDALVEPLHTASDMRGLVRGVVEDGVSGNDAGGRDEHEGDGKEERPPIQQ